MNLTLTLTPTARIVLIDGQPCRVWEGTTAQGTRLFAYVRAIAVSANEVRDNEMVELVEIMALDDPTLGTSFMFQETEFKCGSN